MKLTSTVSRAISPRAFTLMEVAIACGIFFMASFAILALVSTTLRNARALRQPAADAGSVAAQVCLTNKLYEGGDSGDFGQAYPNYTWDYQDMEVLSNGLHQVDIVVSHRLHGEGSEIHMSILLYRPESPPGSASGGAARIGGGVR
jgi:hypothetical protein